MKPTIRAAGWLWLAALLAASNWSIRASQHKTSPCCPFDDTDLYKVIEGASYTLSVWPDPKLDAYVDSMIAKVAAAQEWKVR